MKRYQKSLLATTLVFALGSFLAPVATFAQQTGITRINHQRHDISVPGYETIQASIAFEPGIQFGMHSHPGEEVIYVLEGTFEYQIEGEKPVTLSAGDVLFIPAGKNHQAKNVGKNKAVELATYIVEKGKTLVVMKTEMRSTGS
ncbi:cupin domain-containing protein [Dyadobacter sp. CY261]|uniref:cupin domain-containing protein n=1 Tax=Dyadobacter sp. CY261 TaxID=2907203 RepID=UPI001F2380BB|nr:cupin domain-containing protein [Dyadobacter sp. CY261]MCF0074942.1 cupin domain-containing protein [Dyadobacter sp. CY261]